MRSPRFVSSAAVAALSVIAVRPAQAQVVFGNLDLTPGVLANFFDRPGRIFSYRFTTGSNAVTVGSVQALLRVQNAGDTAVFGYGIYNNVSGLPGTQLFDFGNQTINTPANTVYTFSSGSTFLLNANTTYHLRTNYSSGVIIWPVADPNTDPTAQNGSGIVFNGAVIVTENTGGFVNTTNRLTFQMNSDFGAGVAAPEPGSVALVGVGLAGMMGIVARKRKA